MDDDIFEEEGPGLRDQWAGNCDIVVINAQNRGYQKALEKAYAGLYLPNFPLSEGNDSIDTWREHLDHPSDSDYTITIAGDNLRGDNPHIRGMCVSVYFKNSDTGYLMYVVVDPQHRTEGLGHALFKIHQEAILAAAVRHGKTLSGSFLDCADPARPDEHTETYDPVKRVEKYKKWGGVEIPCDYRLPDKSDPHNRKYDMMLIAFPHPRGGDYPDMQTIIGFITDFYRHEGIADPAQDLEFQTMMRKLQARWNGGNEQEPPAAPSGPESSAP